MRRGLDGAVHGATTVLHRLWPRLPVLTAWPGARVVAKRVYAHLLQSRYERLYIRLVSLHRSRLRDVTFIGVTGSAGKTTTKNFAAAVLATTFPGRKSRHSRNDPYDIARAVRGVRGGDRFAVMELGATNPGDLDGLLALVRPRIGVVTNIGTDHYSAYGSADAIAAEKGKLIRALPPDGVAILNADDPRVLAMRDGFTGRVLTFGLHPEATVRAEAISASWPDRLAFTLVHGAARVRVQTQFCGTHWISSALAAVAVGLALGVPLDAAARALEGVPPFQGRMSPVALPEGVTFIRDDWKASVHTIPPALDYMRQARAPRKVAIIGTIADTMGDAGAIYVSMAKRAIASTDLVCFVGPRASSALRAKTHPGDDRIRAFATARGAAEFMEDFLRPGDLVLLKGSNTADHLYRIILARTRGVACWRADCMRNLFCDECSLLHVPSEADYSGTPKVDSVEVTVVEPGGPAPSHVIVGLGNPGEGYEGTPHNVGRAVVDRLAATLGATWEREPDADLSRAEWKGETVCLVKPRSLMNRTGPVLARLAQRLGVDHARCILVYDDLDLPLGTVRARMRGSDGGHRGVRSIIEAFQTDEIRRVKVGVRREGQTRAAAEAVLTPFTGDETTVMGKACEQAIARLGELVVQRLRPGAVV
jgi:UDP-N-acetylmuramoyl-tripeptide--D-alanyl-D-alanine ligase